MTVICIKENHKFNLYSHQTIKYGPSVLPYSVCKDTNMEKNTVL